MITFPNAKINLGLNITEKRPDGYHNIETIFYPIPLQDTIEVTIRNTPLSFPSPDIIPSDHPLQSYTCNRYSLYTTGIPIAGTPDENLVVKAFRLLDREFNLPAVNIYINKHIPSGAGLGGGSSDAAFMIRLLNKLFDLGLSTTDMEQRAEHLGADCPFFINNQPVLATGIGTTFTPIDLSLKELYIIIVKPNTFISTKEAYSNVTPQHPELPLLDLISTPIKEWKGLLKNNFEESIFPKHPEIAAIKDRLYTMGAIYAAMSGSGSSVFGLFETPVPYVEEQFDDCFFCQHKL